MNLTDRQEKALAALLLHPTQKEAAAACGLTERTLRNYLTDPEFKAAYQEAINGILRDITRQAQMAAGPALSALCDIIEDTETPAAARVSAARAALEYSCRLTEINDFSERLEALERMNTHDN